MQKGTPRFVIALVAGFACGDPTAVSAPQLGPQLSYTNTVTSVDLLLGDAELVSVGSPANGTAAVGNDGVSVRYTPNEGYAGPDSAEYSIRFRGANTTELRILRFRVLPGPYTVVPITAPEGPVTVRYVNDSGVVAGEITTATGATLPILWNGSVTRLSSGGFAGVRATAVNASGVVVGYGAGGVLRWENAAAEPRVIPGSGSRVQINDAGQVATEDDFWKIGQLVALNASNHRLLQGFSVGHPAAYVLRDSTPVWVTEGRHVGTDMNDHGDVIGHHTVFSVSGYESKSRPYLRNFVTGGVPNAQLYEIGAGTPRHISNSRVVLATIGEAGAPAPWKFGIFVGGIHEPLDALVDQATSKGWVIEDVVDMSHRHEIVGYARRNGGERVAVLLRLPR